MFAAIRSFRFGRSLGSIVIYFGCNALFNETGVVEHLVRSFLGSGIISFALAAILSIGIYFGILALSATWYFADAKAGPWEGAVLGVACGVGIVALNIAENDIRRIFGLPVEIVHLGISIMLWLPLVLLFALFGTIYARSRR